MWSCETKQEYRLLSNTYCNHKMPRHLVYSIHIKIKMDTYIFLIFQDEMLLNNNSSYLISQSKDKCIFFNYANA